MGLFSGQKAKDILIILLVFTITGMTVGRLGVWLTGQLGIERFSLAYWAIWIIGLLPLYNVVLITVAALLGKYKFFREKQLKTWRRIKGLFGKK